VSCAGNAPARKIMPSPCANCKLHPKEWDISVYMLNQGTCGAGHKIHTTDVTPEEMYFDENNKTIQTCINKKNK
jgi:hypothetical protein